jgi:glycosyltransferase involved in cell wall biosynthesis
MVNEKEAPKIVRITPLLSTIQAIFRGQNKFLINEGFDVHVVASPDCSIDGFVRAEGFKYHPVNISREIAPHKDLKTIVMLMGLFRRIRPDIVHTHTSKGGFVGMLAAAMSKVKHRVHSIAGWSADSRGKITKSLILASEAITLKLATKVIVNSESLRSYLIEKGYLRPNKGLVLGRGSSNGVDLDFFKRDEFALSFGRSVRQQYGIDKNDIVLAYVGRIMLEKGIRELLNAFLFFKDNPSIHLLIIGSGETKSRKKISDDIFSLLREHPRIHVTGWINNVQQHLAAADILVHPSYHEGMPNVLLQGAAMELPCIASNVRGNKDALIDGETGFLFHLHDTKQLVDLLQRLIADDALRHNMGKKGRAFMKSEFGRDVVFNRLHDFYVNLVYEGIANENITY